MTCHQVDAQGSFFFSLTPEAPGRVGQIVCGVNLFSEDSGKEPNELLSMHTVPAVCRGAGRGLGIGRCQDTERQNH